jgi:hypothetical protein
MTEAQVYLTIGMPTLAVLVGILVNVTQFSALNGRLTAIGVRLDARITALESKFETKFDLLVGKVMEMDNRLTRLEERLKH